MKKFLLLVVCCMFFINNIVSNDTTQLVKPTKWYDAINIRGYMQVRYNRLLETNEKLKCEQCDRSIGENGGFFIRRMRIIFSGNIHKNIYFYIQPDFAVTTSSGLHFVQLRDAYFDLGFDKKNEFRVRIGQSKVPFGFENMQSSQNRLPFDRNDALNSAVSNERDLGVFFYYAPKKIRERYAMLIKDGYKGSGDYGVIGLGTYNGQTANKAEFNKNLHVVFRTTYPFAIKKQIIEPSIQAYTGKYTLEKSTLSTSVKKRTDLQYTDQRIAATFVLYPKPFGIQAEYNFGRGPEYNKTTDSIEVQKLHGGYITLNYKLNIKKEVLYPYVRMQYYNGGKKHELDARSYTVKEMEIGLEWQPIKYFELTAAYVISSRRFEDYTLKNNFQNGKLLRLQAQLNF